MRRRGLPHLAALVLLLAAVPAVAGGAADGTEVVGQATFDVHLGAQRQRVETEGSVPVPADATGARVRLRWNESGPADQVVRLLLCRRTCNGEDRAFRNVTGGSPIEVRVRDLPEDRIGWRATERKAYDVDATGRVLYLGPATGSRPRRDHGSQPSTGVEASQAPSTAPADPDPLLGVPRQLAGVLLTAGAAVASRLAPHLRRWVPFVSRDEAPDHPVRAEIVSLVDDEPGVHVRELRRRLEAGSAQLDHHLRVLRDHDLVEEVEDAGYRCCFPPGWGDDQARRGIARLKSEGGRAVFAALLEADRVGVRALAEALDLAPSTVQYHVDRLAEIDIVEQREDGTEAGLAVTDAGRDLAEAADLG